MSKTVQSNNSAERGFDFKKHAAIGLALAALLITAAIVLLCHFGLTGYQRSASSATPEPVTEAPMPTDAAHPDNTPAPTPAPTGDTPAPEPTEPPVGEFERTLIVIDDTPFACLISRQAAEELISSAVRHFELMCPAAGATTELNSRIGYEPAPEGAALTSFDEAYQRLIAEDTPLVVKSYYAATEYVSIPYERVSEGSGELFEGTRMTLSYGRNGKKLLVYEYTYVNGALVDSGVREEQIIIPSIDESVLIGTRPLPAEDVSGPDFMVNEAPRLAMRILPPVNASIDRFFGFYDGVLHRGVDYAAAEGQNCAAPASGTVTAVIERGALGIMVEIEHADKVVTRCAKLSRADVVPGAQVQAGQIIGAAGQDGLHFEIIVGGLPRNPFAYLTRETGIE